MRLGDWYANVVIFGRRHLLLAVNERTLLPVVVDAAPAAKLLDRLRPSVGDVLRHIGVDEADIARELAAMQDVALAKTASRTVLGTMTDFTNGLGIYLDHGDTNLLAMALRLADTPCSPIQYESPAELTVRQFRAGA